MDAQKITLLNTEINPNETHEELIQEAKRLHQQQLAKGTYRVYLSDGKIFQAWCEQHQLSFTSATPETIALFLADQFKQGFHPSTLVRRLAAIKFMYVNLGKPSPSDSPIVKAMIRGIRRDEKAKPSQPKKAILSTMVKQMADLFPNKTLRDLRNRALLLVGFAGAYRRSELVAINIEDITWQKEGMDIVIHRSKTDPEGKGDFKAILKASDENYCPLLAAQIWITKANLTSGPLFRGIDKRENLKETALSTDMVYNIIKRCTALLGYELHDYSPHSLRSGFIMSAIENGAKPTKIMTLSKHKTLHALQKYIKHSERYDDHPGKNLL
jgi:site-specific recombinase XerD